MNLREKIGAKTLSSGEARRLVRDLALALDRAHEAGLVHGALSPDLVVFDEDDTAELSGLRKEPPPRAPGKEPHSPAADQRALAAVIYESLTGKAPSATGIEPLALLRPELPRPLDTVFARALAPNAEARYPSVLSFARAFEASFERLASPSRVTLALVILGPLGLLLGALLWALSGS